ncbi:MAG: OmpH family outer membrane protein [Bacteroidales bacterium]|nr:OmpH family outer membrane protein [Bacteroidales bacterium]
MKKICSGVAALAVSLFFVNCSGSSTGQGASVPSGADSAESTTTMKFAFVEIDSLLTQYNFWNDLNEAMIKREEDIRVTLNQKGTALEKEAQDFQRKLENNAFATRERAEQEHQRLLKKQQELQELQQKLTEELMLENQKNNLQIRDSINAFMTDFNKTRGYSMIFSKTGFDNLLYGEESFNITKEVVEGLNKRYTPSLKK